VEAGIAVEECLALVGHTGRSRTKRVLAEVREAVKAGSAFHEALGRFPNCFPPVYRALVQAGEMAGNLGPTLRRLGDDLAARRALVEEVRNALVYPVFLTVTATAGMLVLLLVVAPSLETLLAPEAGDRLPAVTRAVLAASHGLRDHGGLLGLGAGGLMGIPIGLALHPAGRNHLDRLVLKAPLLGGLVRTIETGRFTRTLGALLAGGIAPAHAIRIALATVANRRMRAGLEDAYRGVVSGAMIGEAVAASGVFDVDAVGLIRVGERTGRLAETLDRAATLHEARATRRLKALTALLTPIITIGFGVVAGLIVYAMLSTILGINELAGP
jgi:type II secretory pathway component PulF